MNDPYRTNARYRAQAFFNWDDWRLRYMRFFTKRREFPKGLQHAFLAIWHTVLGAIIVLLVTVVAFKVGAFLNEVIFGNLPVALRTPVQREDTHDGYYAGTWCLGFVATTSVVWLRFLYRNVRDMLVISEKSS